MHTNVNITFKSMYLYILKRPYIIFQFLKICCSLYLYMIYDQKHKSVDYAT